MPWECKSPLPYTGGSTACGLRDIPLSNQVPTMQEVYNTYSLLLLMITIHGMYQVVHNAYLKLYSDAYISTYKKTY